MYALCNALASLPSVTVKILTTDSAGPKISDRIAVASVPVTYPPGYEVYFSTRVAGASVAPGMMVRLRSMVRWADIIHLTGIYSFPTIPTLAACKLAHKTLVWSPRGAFYDWSGSRRQRIKALWLKSCQMLLPTRVTIHCASEKERAEAQSRMPGISAAVVPNGVDIPRSLGRGPVSRKGFSLLYLGLISPVKALDVLLRAMALLDADVTLDVYGHAPMGYEHYGKHMLTLAGELGLGSRVAFHGFVLGENKTAAFLKADLCVVPSHSENFSNVIAEALSFGVPVVASRGTPWSALEDRGCGFWVDNSPESLSDAIRRMRDMNLAQMGARGRAWMEQEFGWDSVARSMFEVYERASTRTLISPA